MATLKSLVDETTNIKDELVECHNNLKNNLNAKGVEVLDLDKMSSLIDKVGDIETSVKVVISDNILCNFLATATSRTGILNFEQEHFKYICTFEGSVRFSTKAINSGAGTGAYFIVRHLRGEEVLYQSESQKVTSTATEYAYDIDNIKVNDVINMICYSSASGISTGIFYTCLKGDVI